MLNSYMNILLGTLQPHETDIIIPISQRGNKDLERLNDLFQFTDLGIASPFRFTHEHSFHQATFSAHLGSSSQE